jgi:2-methylcitrate dehydratase PrpD
MPFCAAAAIVYGRIGVDTFEAERISEPQVAALMRRVSMTVDPTLDAGAPPLTQARVHVHLSDGRTLTETANGARGYPDRPASDEELAGKFLGCATRAIPPDAARRALALLRDLDSVDDVRALAAVCSESG